MSAHELRLHDPERALFLKAVAVSAGIHLLLIASAGMASLFHKQPEWKDLSMQVTLVGAPRGGKGAAGHKAPSHNSAEQKKNLPATRPQAKEETHKVIKKPELHKTTEKKSKKHEQKNMKTEEKTKNQQDIPNVENEIKKSARAEKPVEVAKNTNVPADDGTTAETPDASGNGETSETGETGYGQAMEGIEGDIRMMYYREEAAAKLFEAWSPPMSVPVNRGLHFDVIIRVDAKGKVLDYKVLYKSGNADMDRSVMSLLKQIDGLPPLPYAPESGVQELPFRFVPEEDEWK